MAPDDPRKRQNPPPLSTSTTFFDHASQVQITGTTNFNVENHGTHLSGRTPVEILLSHCALDALVNSKERYDPPKCAPDTRDAIQQQIIEWIFQATLSGLVLWLTGSAGAGKSAVAQNIAERFKDQDTPSVSFFFSRISGSATRVDGDRLIPTIIYQLCQLFPEYKAAVLKKIKKEPEIFQLTREYQMATLITKPLQQFSFRRWLREFRGGRPYPILIVIDGLDECRDPQTQCDLLRIIADAAVSCRQRPLRFLLTSRPEAHITRVFNQHPNFVAVGLRRINLDEDQDAAIGILTFLRQEFRKIHEQHPLSYHLDSSWPSDEILDLIVSKSSPQFILASTAMSYVSSPKHHPTDRLAIIIDILTTTSNLAQKDQPLEKLDLLYTMIFNNIEEDHRVLVQTLLGILHLASHDGRSIPPPTAQFLEKVLNLPNGEVRLRLEPLASVLHIPEPHLDLPIRSLHASLFDFLMNSSRSHELVLNLDYARAGLIGYNLLQDPDDPVTRQFAHQPTIQQLPTLRTSLEGLLITLLIDGFPSEFYPIQTGTVPEVEAASKPVKLVSFCLGLLQSCYARQGLSDRQHDLNPTFRAALNKFYSDRSSRRIDFQSCAVELQHCLYHRFLPFLSPHLTLHSFQDHQNLRLHLLLYQVTSFLRISENMKTWTLFGGLIRHSNTLWTLDSERQELAELCQRKILALPESPDHEYELRRLKATWTHIFSEPPRVRKDSK